MYKNLTKTLFAGHNLVYLTHCHSTNDHAAKLVTEQSVLDGTVIITDNQTSGKGQRGNAWEAQPRQNLTFSIIFKPKFLLPQNNFRLNPTISLAVADFLSLYLDSGISIKWPNDIYFHDSKIGGILIENSVHQNLITHSIAGIGLNVNQLEFSGYKATSMAREAKREFILEEIFPVLITHLESRYLQLRSDGWPQIRELYLKGLYRINQTHTFKAGEVFQGKIVGIDDFGRLKIEKSEGSTEAFDIKEIQYL